MIPHILQSDNVREFKNNILYSLINEDRPNTKILHGNPRHPESEGSVERANRDLKNALASKIRATRTTCVGLSMLDVSNSRRIQHIIRPLV